MSGIIKGQTLQSFAVGTGHKLDLGSKPGVRRFLTAASMSAMAAAMPGAMGVYGTRAFGQALPVECVDDDGNLIAEDGDLITCLMGEVGDPIDSISTDVDDLTITIGDVDNSARVLGLSSSSSEFGGSAVQMTGGGAQTLNILNSETLVFGETGVAVLDRDDSVLPPGDINIRTEGSIYGIIVGVATEGNESGNTTITLGQDAHILGGSAGILISQEGDGGSINLFGEAGGKILSANNGAILHSNNAEINIDGLESIVVTSFEDGVFSGGSFNQNAVLDYVELGAVFDQQFTDRIGAFGRISGVQYFGDTETAFVSSFIAAPVGTSAFRTVGDTVEQQLEIDANLSLRLPHDFHLSAGGFAEVCDLEVQGAQISLVKAF